MYIPVRIPKYITKVRPRFIHLCYHKFNHGFVYVVDLLCSFSTTIRNTVNYFLHCPNFSTLQNTFLSEITIAARSIIDENKIKVIQNFLYGNPTYSVNDNKIFNANVKCILQIKTLERPVLQVKEPWSVHSFQNRTTLLIFSLTYVNH